MNAQEQTKIEEINSQGDALDDLPLAVEQADRATGGTVNNRGLLIVGVDK